MTLCFEHLFHTYDFLSAEREQAEIHLAAYAAQFPEVARLDSIPGIGHILAAVIWGEIGDLSRFASAQALVNAAGLTPRLHQSGEVSIRGPITRQGSSWLRWAFVTAANSITRRRGPRAQRYWRLRRHKKPNVAKTAVAASIARCAFGVLKHGEDYQAERWGRKTGDEMEQEA